MAVAQRQHNNYDANGNLSSRSHSFGTLSNNASYNESYSYDGLNRLTGRSVTTIGQGTMPSAYNMNESYAYDAFGNFTSKGANNYYQYNANKRLTGIYDNPGLTGSSQYDFAYDSNGNIVGDGSRNMLYSSFAKPIQINKGQTATSFIYGMGHKRYYRHDKRATAGVETDTHTAYLGGLEKIYRTKAGNDSDLLEYKVYVGNIVITERTNTNSNASTDESYLHKDHLGSPLTITDKSGKVIQQNVYDPWGKVHKLYSDEIALGGNLQPTTRGFTGHEGLDGLDIIHMNGRIYDANIGRFLQADPHIQAPTNSQSFNRYAYVINNPLSFTDPSGFFFKKLLKSAMRLNGSWFTHQLLNRIPILKGIVSVALNFIPGCQVWCTAVFNAMSTFVATGSLTQLSKPVRSRTQQGLPYSLSVGIHTGTRRAVCKTLQPMLSLAACHRACKEGSLATVSSQRALLLHLSQ